MKCREFITPPILAVILAVLLALAPTAVASNTWYVNGVNGNDSDDCKTPTTACKTIGHAISLAASGDSIIVAPATYTEHLTIGFSLNVIGSSASRTIIDGQRTGSVIVITGANSQITLSNVTIRNGYAAYGGGIYNAGKLTINNSMITGNSVWGCPGFGGGILNYGTATINNSTLSGNAAGGRNEGCSGTGGGIYNWGTLSINNSTLTGNTAFWDWARAYGGGIYNRQGTVAISSSTISGNNAVGLQSQGGAIYGGAILQNSILANNKPGNCSSGMSSQGYNLSSDGTCNFNSRGDLNNHDPLLGPLQNNGGPTETMALLAGSPAIDAGNPAGCTDGQSHLLKTDQRGMPRPDKEDSVGCDMGAYESQSDQP